MKIIRHGTVPPAPEPWWAGKRKSCPKCSTLIEIEAKDFDTTADVIAFNCRLCGEIITLSNLRKRLTTPNPPLP